ncbi:MAG: hydrogenase maturation nickel metallochaperone HypA [Candidatus Omnitrophica bacterium]|nr:hydrogenase maturation nickel metallochaperone HypA [Candidatus Omnitrophota bacterium]MBU1996964.1 hydrogenase maturation nickel metallochaperone HypA [Candidatus Omnitrophota bacterium]
MHELSIIVSMMEQIVDVAKENKIEKIDEVHLETGVLRQVIPEVMQEAFASVKLNTICENAILQIIEAPALVLCKQCKSEFEPSIDDFICKICNLANVDILKGNEIILKAVIGDSRNESF